MENYLKLFNDHTGYSEFTETPEFILPNVSHCILENHVHYNPREDDVLTLVYNIEDNNEEFMPIYVGTEFNGNKGYEGFLLFFEEDIEIDGISYKVLDLDTLINDNNS